MLGAPLQVFAPSLILIFMNVGHPDINANRYEFLSHEKMLLHVLGPRLSMGTPYLKKETQMEGPSSRRLFSKGQLFQRGPFLALAHLRKRAP